MLPLRFLAPALALFCFAQRSIAYSLEGYSWPPGSVVTFQLSLGLAAHTLTDGNTSFDAAAAPAVAAWDSVMRQLQFHTSLGASPAVSGDGINSVAFASTIFGQSFGANTLAVTYYRTSGSQMLETDVLFNDQISFDSYRGPLRYGTNGLAVADIRRVLIHELGHALGLDHPDSHGQHVDAIMNSATSDRETLATDDIAGARSLYGTPPGQALPITGDFNGDGFGDYLLLNASTRQTAIWHLESSLFLSGGFGPTLPAGWRVACVADFNLDGKADYLLFNGNTRQTAIWFLNDTKLSGGVVGRVLPAGWILVAAADFNHDGRPDYALFNPSTHQTAVWYMNGATYINGAFGPTIPPGWTVVDASDFNGDGSADFLLFKTNTHQTAIWYLKGSTLAGGAWGPTLPAGWTLQGSSDFNYDGKPDYVLFNSATRQTAIWYLKGTAVTAGALGPTLPPGYSFGSP